jgi:ribokinase
MARIAVLGAAALDIIIKVKEFPQKDCIVFPISKDICPGGSTANIAVGLKRLGIDSVFLGKVGEDRNGEIIIREFLKEEVETTHIIVEKDGETAGAFIAVDNSGDRMIYSLGGKPLYEKKDEMNLVNFDGLDGIYIGEVLPDIGALAEQMAKDRGIKVFFNPGTISSYYGLDNLQELIKGCDYLFLSLPELINLTGCSDKQEGIKKLLDMEVPNLIITEGSRGAGFYSKKEEVFIPAFKTEVVDTTGAGDSFTSGFIKGIYSGFEIGECLRLGNACAALAIQKIGARSSMPVWEEAAKFLGREF